jgi:fumarate reductase subunit D
MKKDSEPLYWLGLVLGAIVFAITPLITIGVPLPAFFLPKGLLNRHAERILSHPVYLLRQSALLVRLSAGMCWGADAAVRGRFNLPPYGPDPGTFRTS